MPPFPRSSTQTSPVVERVVTAASPVLSSPARPLEVIAWLDAFDTSLMPRTSRLQGVVGGLAVLSADAVSRVVERTVDVMGRRDATPGRRMAIRAGLGLVGTVATTVRVDEGTSMWRAGMRSGGALLRVAVLGGGLHELAGQVRRRWPDRHGRRLVANTALSTTGVVIWAGRRLAERSRSVEPWPVEQRNTLPASFAATVAVAAVGRGVARGYGATRDALRARLGPGVPEQVLARSVNAVAWVGLATAAYNLGVALVGRANERVEPAYAAPPVSPLRSGSAPSVSPFEDLGMQGRRYVTDVVTPTLVREALGEEAVAEPVRVFVGFNSEPLYATGRAELALDELERSGAYDRRHLLLVAPTGTGWVDNTMIEAAELLSRGDIATACLQYGRFPSFLSVQKVALGRAQFRLLLMGVRERLRERPPDRRPRVLVFGESLGAWAASDVVMYQGIDGFDHYGIDRALWVGLPGLAKWSRNGMTQGRSDLVPTGTVRLVDHPGELESLSAHDRARLRATVLSHANDPIAVLSPDLLLRRPGWLDGQRGRGVPPDMPWRPLVTFWQVAIDAANAMVTVPGEFRSFGHDYRADMARAVLHAYDLPAVTAEQLSSVESTLRRLEIARAERIGATEPTHAPPPPTHADPAVPRMVGGVPLRGRTRGARWARRVPA